MELLVVKQSSFLITHSPFIKYVSQMMCTMSEWVESREQKNSGWHILIVNCLCWHAVVSNTHLLSFMKVISCLLSWNISKKKIAENMCKIKSMLKHSQILYFDIYRANIRFSFLPNKYR
jgi:hypothetical protein